MRYLKAYSIWLIGISTLAPANVASQTAPSIPAPPTVELLQTAPNTNGALANHTSCYNPWASEGQNLANRVRRLMNSPYRTGFGKDTTGGTENLVVVTNPSATGPGSFNDIVSKTVPGDYIVFDASNNIYQNGCGNGGCKIPGSVTIDGSLPNGKHVVLKRSDSDTYNRSLSFQEGNNIVTNIEIDHNNLSSAITIGNGENYWLNSFEVKAYKDDALTIGNPTNSPSTSADKITISKYKVTTGIKGLLVLSAGNSCNGSSSLFDPTVNYGGAVPTDIAINQRRAKVTIINSQLAANTRNIFNQGGYADIIGSYIHGGAENTIGRYGSQTIIRCSYVDSRTVLTRAIRADAGQAYVGKNKAGVSYCPQEAEVFLDGNIYRQPNFPAETTDPRINESKSDIDTGVGGHITDGIEFWNNPPTGRNVFNRSYETDILPFCTAPSERSDAGPDFSVEEHCD